MQKLENSVTYNVSDIGVGGPKAKQHSINLRVEFGVDDHEQVGPGVGL